MQRRLEFKCCGSIKDVMSAEESAVTPHYPSRALCSSFGQNTLNQLRFSTRVVQAPLDHPPDCSLASRTATLPTPPPLSPHWRKRKRRPHAACRLLCDPRLIQEARREGARGRIFYAIWE
jgi:hypothetical protein